MAILTLNDFVARLIPGTRLMSLDVGAKTIGLATAVWGQELVMPLKTLHRQKFTADAAQISQLITEYDVRGLVIGWPLGLDGSFTRRCQSVQDFTKELDRALGEDLPITFFDERFSTQAGQGRLDDPDAALQGQGDALIDALAAQVILEDFLTAYGPCGT